MSGKIAKIQTALPGMALPEAPEEKQKKKVRTSQTSDHAGLLPENLGKAIRLPVPDFSDPDRKLTCLEADFPIAQINALSNLEGNAGKPIYQMSKWWARRRSSVFRSMLIAAATEAPDDPNEAAKRVWDHYYCNHQKAGSFKKLRVLDCFMGGGTTLVEGSRLGMQMTGVDLNPVAWFVVKNELACSDPEQVKALFAYIESQVKPQIQPFYTTTCSRGHQGRWIDVQSGETVEIEPMDLSPEQRPRYCWEGPEVIYTFWAKHGPCQAKGCGHRTPIFRTPVIAEKNLSTNFIECTCPKCATSFHAELGETRMAPGAERVVIDEAIPFTELGQLFAKLLNDYDKGSANDTFERSLNLKEMVAAEKGLCCPECGTFSGKKIADILEQHCHPSTKSTEIKKKAFKIQKKKVQMYLLIHPEWMKGASGFDGENELGGWAGAPAKATSEWFEDRLDKLSTIEVRSKSLPDVFTIADGTIVETSQGTVPRQAHFTCATCGREGKILESVRPTGHTAPVAAYTLQCHCPQCEIEGYTYSGRYFKAPDAYDIQRLTASEKEWGYLSEDKLKDYWPRQKMLYAHMTHERNPLPDHGYTHWWKFFNSRQLVVLANLLAEITNAPKNGWSIDVSEQALGAFQQYLQNQSMFCHYDTSRDTSTVLFSNNDFRPKNLACENNAYSKFGRGNFLASPAATLEGISWVRNPYEPLILLNSAGGPISLKCESGDPVISGSELFCFSSTEIENKLNGEFDLIITDPPFGDNVFYADLSDFFYVWLRIPLCKWYSDLPEGAYFVPERTPHSMEAVDNAAEHPDDRETHERDPFITLKHLSRIQELTNDNFLAEKALNPLYRPQPSSDFYCQTLSAVWAAAGRLLKNNGIMAFTFHHNEDQAWVDVLRALFDAGYVLTATYPIRSDESKGVNAEFGSKKIEYDIIHVCRKRIATPEPVSWARMRRWVKDEASRLKDLLEHTHGKTLPESDLRVILRGKSLEFYSRHYGQVLSGDGQILEVREALLGINQLLDDLLEDTTQTGGLRTPESAEPTSRLYLRLFKQRTEMDRDELHKTLRGTGISQGDLESRGWIRVVGKTVYLVPIRERFSYFTVRGRNRKVIRNDLDQVHFLIGVTYPNSGLKIDAELNNPNFRIKKSVDEILKWYAEVDQDAANRLAARTAAQLVGHWRTNKGKRPETKQLSLFEMLEEAD